MNRSNFAPRIFFLVAAVLLFTPILAQAQFRASLRGTVTDSQGAVIPGATVTLTDKNTGSTTNSTSDPNGIYQFNALAPNPYRLTAQAQGFKQKVLQNVQIIPDQPNALDVQLEIGTAQESITVSGTTEALDTETANLSGTVTSNEVQHMPSFGRDVLKLAELAPGTFGDNSQASGSDNYNLPGTQTGGGASGANDGIFKTENGVQVISAGNQTENNGISIDGISTTSAVWGGATVITPSEDSVQDVKIVSNSYDAEEGRFAGAQVQITSKGGTNDVHGSLFFTTHQPNLNAYQPPSGIGNPKLRDENKFSQFGGSVGGPIWKNKIFAFFNYETVREPNSAVTNSEWYDTPAFDALAPSGSIASRYLSFPGNGVVSTGINVSGSTCANAGLINGVNCRNIPGQGINVGTPLTTPLGTQDLTWVSPLNPGVGSGLGTVADLALYNTVNPTTFTAGQYNGRLDVDATTKDRITFAIYWVPLTKTNYNNNRAYDIFHHTQINDAFSLIWNHTISSTFLNEARANAAGWRWNEVSSNPQSPVGLPTDLIGAIGTITPGQFGPSVGSILNQWTYSYKDVATKILGRQTIKFGGEATRLFYLQNCPGCAVPQYNFFNLWDFLNDAPKREAGNFNPATGLPTTIRQDDRENLYGFFVQDDYKLRKNLTINAGLRYSYFGSLYSKEGNMFQAVPGVGTSFMTGLVVHRGNAWNPEKNNFGPQIGFAWSPSRFNDKLVVRGGYGLNYNQEEIAISSNIVNNPGLVVAPSFDSNSPTSINPGIVYAPAANLHNLNTFPSNPNTVSTFGANGLPTTGQVNIQLFPGARGTLPTMRVHHYSADMQYDLGHQYTMMLGYQGSLSRDTYFHENPDAAPAAEGLLLNPQVGGGDYWNVVGSGNYNALLSEVKHQFSQQFMADAQFAWSKSNDTSSAPYSEQDYPYDVNLNYGPSDYNVGKAFKLFALYQPVFFKGNRGWLDKIVGGWSLSGILNIHSGFPYTPVASVNGGSLYCGTCGYTQLLPAAYLGGAGNSTTNQAFEPPVNSNFPAGGMAYFATPTYTVYNGANYGSALPQPPGVHRNFLTGPGYRDVDMTVSKSFGLPNNKVLGEGAKIEVRMDAYNVFNNLNFNENTISNNIAATNFGTYSSALTGRTLAFTARFNF